MNGKKSRQQVWQDRVDSHLTGHRDDILQDFPSITDYSSIEKIAAIHYHVYVHISYEKRDFSSKSGREFRDPAECWNQGGNCQEQTVLLASLVQDLPRVSTRTLGLGKENAEIGHRILEVNLPYHPEDVINSLKQFYKQSPRVGKDIGEFSWTNAPDNSYTWIVADPVMSNYIGDISSLTSQGYAADYGDSWEWHQIKDTCDLTSAPPSRF